MNRKQEGFLSSLAVGGFGLFAYYASLSATDRLYVGIRPWALGLAVLGFGIAFCFIVVAVYDMLGRD